MAEKKNIHTVPTDDGWVNRREGAKRASSTLCAGRSDNVVRYVLAGTKQPLAVADYTYDTLPGNLRDAVPNEAELDRITDDALHQLEADRRP